MTSSKQSPTLGLAFYQCCARQRDELLTQYRSAYGHANPIPAKCLLGIAALLGLRVIYTELALHIRGEYDAELQQITVNYVYPETTVSTTVRSNLTITHELGHHMLHRGELLAGVRRPEIEDEARAWARVFLLPRRHLVVAVEKFGAGASVAQLARAFQVSPAVVQVRLREIDLVLDRGWKQGRVRSQKGVGA